MRRLLWVSLLLVCMVAFSPENCLAQDGQLDVVRKKVFSHGRSLEATVVRIERTSLTLQYTPTDRVCINLSEKLAKGGFSTDGPNHMYKASDVRAGDKILVYTARYDGVEEIQSISILRRPGGRVPPSHENPPDYKHHERMNAFQDLEKRGIPLPEKYQLKPPPR